VTVAPDTRECPDCGEPLVFAFIDTAGVGAHKRGDHFNTTPDTVHYVCFGCAKAWKQRLSGALTPDIVGDLALFTCAAPDCGRPLRVTHESATPTEVALACAAGHQFGIAQDQNGLSLRR
jgi:hypothetical protein